MKRILTFLLLFAAIKVAGQTTGYLRFDTVRIMKQNGTCELYIINKTKDSLGLLTNVGGGLTQFRRSRMLNDSTLIIGLDTLTVHGTGGGITTVNLDTSRTSTTTTIIASGTDAVLNLVDRGSSLAGLMSPTDKGRLDSLYAGLLNDSIEVVQVGRSTGKTVTYAKNDTLWSKRLIDSTYISWHTLNDSTLVGVLDTAGLHTAFGSGGSGTPGGSNTQLQYNNSGAFGGTSGGTWDATNTGITITKNSLGTTQNNLSGFILSNTTAAAAGAQQISPPLIFSGGGWKTNSTAASQVVTYRMDIVPVQGSANPSAYLRVQQSINGGAYSQVAEFYNTGIRLGDGSGGGINLSGTPGSTPSSGNITSLNGVAFGTAGTGNQNTYALSTAAGWGAVVSGRHSLLQLAAGTNGFAPTSGVATYAHLNMLPRINQTGTSSGITYGALVDNTNITSAVDYRSIEIINYNSAYGFRCDSPGVKHYLAGELNIGNSTDQGAFKLQNTGGLYQNGSVSLNATPTASGTFTVLTKQPDSTLSQVSLANLLSGLTVSSGTYTATLTNGTNVASSAFQQAFYQRIGSIVRVQMYITIDPTSTGATDLEISLPFASDLAAGTDLLGDGNCTSVPAQTVTLGAQTTNNRATLSFTATDTNSQAFYFSFTYQIL